MTRPPSPEEVQKEFEDFVKERFGSKVQVVTQHMTPNMGPTKDEEDSEDLGEDAEEFGFDLNFDYIPKDIKNHLDRFVIQQDDAKRALAIAVCDHYNHVREYHENKNIRDQEYAKQNVLVLGPTGVGKTYLVKQIAKLIGVPFVKADATRFSETGYVGSNVDDLIHELVNQANGDIELAQYGIVYLDEADKLAAADNYRGKDVSGRGVQFGLLKLMEETEVDLRSGNDMRSQMQAFMEFQQKGKLEPRIINTRHILFIISGAFTGLVDIIKERLETNNIGFSRTGQSARKSDEDYFCQSVTNDFIKFGFEPEFVGRLPIRVACQHLDVDDLFEILRSSEGSIIKQYERAFAAYGLKVSFQDDGLRRIAELAEKEKTGARALLTVCERILRNFKYELPGTSIKEVVVDRSLVDNPDGTLKTLLEDCIAVKTHPLAVEVKQYIEGFNKFHDTSLTITREAAHQLCVESQESQLPVDQYCGRLFDNFEHGLALIKQNTGEADFEVDLDVVKDPRGAMERWIKTSYEKSGQH